MKKKDKTSRMGDFSLTSNLYAGAIGGEVKALSDVIKFADYGNIANEYQIVFGLVSPDAKKKLQDFKMKRKAILSRH